MGLSQVRVVSVRFVDSIGVRGALSFPLGQG